MRELVELVIRGVHLVAAIVWLGGVVFYTGIALPILNRSVTAEHLLVIHNRFRTLVRLLIHILLTTGAMVLFIVALETQFFTDPGGTDIVQYMIVFVVKLAAFGVMWICWGVYSGGYRRHLENAPPDAQAVPHGAFYLNICKTVLLVAGLIVFALAAVLKIEP